MQSDLLPVIFVGAFLVMVTFLVLIFFGVKFIRNLSFKEPTIAELSTSRAKGDSSVPIASVKSQHQPPPQELEAIGHRPRIFISYSREDAEFAQKLNADLRRHKMSTWIDEIGIRSGEDWPQRIVSAIETCQLVLVILSPHAIASKWVRRELDYADAKGKWVLPLVYRSTALPSTFELRFGNVQRADFTRGNYDANFSRLLASIKLQLGPDSEK